MDWLGINWQKPLTEPQPIKLEELVDIVISTIIRTVLLAKLKQVK